MDLTSSESWSNFFGFNGENATIEQPNNGLLRVSTKYYIHVLDVCPAIQLNKVYSLASRATTRQVYKRRDSFDQDHIPAHVTKFHREAERAEQSR
jgi:hypothetical protein